MRNPGEPLRDHTGEMRSHHGPTDEAIEALLDGTPSQELVGTPLADLVDRIRVDAATTEPSASPELASLMVHGLAPAEMGDLPATAGSSATAPTSASWLPQWTRRRRMITQAIIAKLAAASLVAKAGVAGAAVVVTAAGVGAVVQLPDQAEGAAVEEKQDGAEEVAEAEAEQAEAAEENGDEAGPDCDKFRTSDEETEKDNFGARVSRDATGCDGSDRGVNGVEISAEAQARAEARAEARAKERADAGRETGAEASEGRDEGAEPGDEAEAGIENAPEGVVEDSAGDGSDDEVGDEGTENAGESNAPSDVQSDVPPVDAPASGPDAAGQGD